MLAAFQLGSSCTFGAAAEEGALPDPHLASEAEGEEDDLDVDDGVNDAEVEGEEGDLDEDGTCMGTCMGAATATAAKSANAAATAPAAAARQ